MQKGFIGILVIMVVVISTIIGGSYYFYEKDDFENCAKARGSLIELSYPARCVTADGRRVTEKTPLRFIKYIFSTFRFE